MRTDESRVGRHGGDAGAGELALDAADIGHERTGGEGGGDLFREFDDFFNRRGEHDEAGGAYGFLGRVGDLSAPGLCAELCADLGAAGPDDDAFGELARMSGAGNRAAEQARGKDGQLF